MILYMYICVCVSKKSTRKHPSSNLRLMGKSLSKVLTIKPFKGGRLEGPDQGAQTGGQLRGQAQDFSSSFVKHNNQCPHPPRSENFMHTDSWLC